MTDENEHFLKERAKSFRRTGKRLLEEGTYDLAAFNLHQAMELRIKHELRTSISDYPTTHSLKVLLENLGNVRDDPEFEEFLDENIDVISNLENAYITSRYLPGDFRESEVDHMEKLVEIFYKFLETK